jgi:hypothetical protein
MITLNRRHVELLASVLFVGMAILLTFDFAVAACVKECKKYDCHGWISTSGTEFCNIFEPYTHAREDWHCKNCDGGTWIEVVGTLRTLEWPAENCTFECGTDETIVWQEVSGCNRIPDSDCFRENGLCKQFTTNNCIPPGM